ncbi:MAG TPA: SAM-dependent methyltransferase, partial [Aggregicoccus sp.]|nr:SAM-dependent methyltransferase [Aggregicoccus sp.]
MRFHAEPLVLIVRHLREALAQGASQVQLEVTDPDLGRGLYPGERTGPGAALVHRPLRAWCDLAEGLGCRLLTPRPVEGGTHVRLTLEPLGPEAGFHAGRKQAPHDAPRETLHDAPRHERYVAGSDFARTRKLEDPGFLLPWLEALGRLPLPPGARVLDLGVNRGDELAAFGWLTPPRED